MTNVDPVVPDEQPVVWFDLTKPADRERWRAMYRGEPKPLSAYRDRKRPPPPKV